MSKYFYIRACEDLAKAFEVLGLDEESASIEAMRIVSSIRAEMQRFLRRTKCDKKHIKRDLQSLVFIMARRYRDNLLRIERKMRIPVLPVKKK